MITIVVGTNRKNSNSEIIAKHFSRLLNQREIDNQMLKLEDLPPRFIETDMYGERSEDFLEVAQKYIIDVDKFVFVIPEYNGGFPGILKTFVDALSPRWIHYKKAVLIGLSSGHAGSLRGMDQFTNVLNYLRVHVHYHKPKLSQIENALSSEGVLVNDRALQELDLLSTEISEF